MDTYLEGNISQRKLAKRFQVTPSFVQKLLKQYRETGSLSPKKRQVQTPTKLNEAQLQLLADLVEQNNDATLEELKGLVFEKTGVSIGRSTVDRMLKKLNLTRKKSLYPTQKGTERVQRLRVDYWEQMRDLKAENLIFIDESGVNLAMTRSHARAPKGKRAYAPVSKAGSNVSIIGAMSLNQVLARVALTGSINTLTFEAFIHQRLIPKLWKGACIILDNCSIHFSEDMKQWIEAAGAHLIYLPPYSPEFSPIENCWSKVKSLLRRAKAQSYDELNGALEQAFQAISPEDIKGWFSHCCYCT